MLGKSPKPVIEVLTTGSLVSSNRAGPVDIATSPRPDMEPMAQSTRGLKSLDLGGVGLGIVAALEKSGSASKALFGLNLSRSNPIPVRSRDKIHFRIQSSVKSDRGSVFHISPPKIAGLPPPDFLSACDLCQKELHGIDIYMYRGEKAFCSTECRYKQMRMEERKEKCISEASRPPGEVVGSPYANDKILNTGIFAV